MKKYLVLLLTVAMVLSMFAGCTGSPAAPAEEPAAGETATVAPEATAEATPERTMKDELRIAMRQSPTNLDIVLNTADVSVEIVGGSVFEQLMAADSNGDPKPELCTSCDVNEDSTIYTYHLRQGVKFHNGEEMKAADVVASMNRWIDNASTVQSMVGEARFYAVDDYTLAKTSSGILARNCANTASVYCLPMAAAPSRKSGCTTRSLRKSKKLALSCLNCPASSRIPE